MAAFNKTYIKFRIGKRKFKMLVAETAIEEFLKHEIFDNKIVGEDKTSRDIIKEKLHLK